jgi:hypothetical protein
VRRYADTAAVSANAVAIKACLRLVIWPRRVGSSAELGSAPMKKHGGVFRCTELDNLMSEEDIDTAEVDRGTGIRCDVKFGIVHVSTPSNVVHEQDVARVDVHLRWYSVTSLKDAHDLGCIRGWRKLPSWCLTHLAFSGAADSACTYAVYRRTRRGSAGPEPAPVRRTNVID